MRFVRVQVLVVVALVGVVTACGPTPDTGPDPVDPGPCTGWAPAGFGGRGVGSGVAADGSVALASSDSGTLSLIDVSSDETVASFPSVLPQGLEFGRVRLSGDASAVWFSVYGSGAQQGVWRLELVAGAAPVEVAGPGVEVLAVSPSGDRAVLDRPLAGSSSLRELVELDRAADSERVLRSYDPVPGPAQAVYAADATLAFGATVGPFGATSVELNVGDDPAVTVEGGALAALSADASVAYLTGAFGAGARSFDRGASESVPLASLPVEGSRFFTDSVVAVAEDGRLLRSFVDLLSAVDDALFLDDPAASTVAGLDEFSIDMGTYVALQVPVAASAELDVIVSGSYLWRCDQR